MKQEDYSSGDFSLDPVQMFSRDIRVDAQDHKKTCLTCRLSDWSEPTLNYYKCYAHRSYFPRGGLDHCDYVSIKIRQMLNSFV